jgi:hypothetical protein
LNVHTSHPSITQNGPAAETRQPYFIVAEIGDDLRNIFSGLDTVAWTLQLTPKYPAGAALIMPFFTIEALERRLDVRLRIWNNF